jgi:hypothetical protein
MIGYFVLVSLYHSVPGNGQSTMTPERVDTKAKHPINKELAADLPLFLPDIPKDPCFTRFLTN